MAVGDLVELGGGLLAPGPLGGPVRGVDQSERAVLGRLGDRVVAQVGGEERVHARRTYVFEEAVAGAAADRDGTDEGVRVARDPYALRGGGEAVGDAGGEVPEGDG